MSPILHIPRASAWNLHEVVHEYRACREITFDAPPRVLDIGAHVGLYALWMLEVWPGAQITCYEPHPETFEHLAWNIAGTGVEAVNVAIVGAGAPADVTLYEGRQTRLACSLKSGRAQREDGVRVKTFPASVLPDADAVKVDCEGSEIEILGGYFLDRKHAPAVVLYEWHSPADREELARIMKVRGYRSVDEVVAGSCGTQVWMREPDSR